MKFLLPSVVIFLVLCQVFGEELGPKEDLDYWTGSNQVQVSNFIMLFFIIINLCQPIDKIQNYLILLCLIATYNHCC
uniref:Uncharacterized protein n=1 Tax=Cyprinus carpio TaxID=7962 RepID=A0A8C2FI24_CYPCA